jgi:hypothetical protein
VFQAQLRVGAGEVAQREGDDDHQQRQLVRGNEHGERNHQKHGPRHVAGPGVHGPARLYPVHGVHGGKLRELGQVGNRRQQADEEVAGAELDGEGGEDRAHREGLHDLDADPILLNPRDAAFEIVVQDRDSGGT